MPYIYIYLSISLYLYLSVEISRKSRSVVHQSPAAVWTVSQSPCGVPAPWYRRRRHQGLWAGETHGKPMVNPRVNDFFGWLDGVIMLKRITSPKDKHGKVEDCS